LGSVLKTNGSLRVDGMLLSKQGEDGRRFLLDKSWTGGNKQITDRHLLKNWQVVVQIALLTKKKAGQTAPIFASIQRFFGIAGLC